MVEALKKEGEDDVKQRQFCVDAFNEHQAAVQAETANKDKQHATVEALSEKLKTIAGQISILNGQIAEAQKQRDQAKKGRDAEKKDFQTTIADQKATQALLKKAFEVLKGAYQFAQIQAHHQAQDYAEAKPEIPKGFSSYKKNANGVAVLNLVQQIIQDTKALQADTERAEKEAAKNYQKLVAATTKSIGAMQTELTNQAGNKAQAEQELAAAKKSEEGAMAELADLASEAAALHESCDFIQNNFDLRKTARDEEMDGLRTAKNILSGMNFLQKA